MWYHSVKFIKKCNKNVSKNVIFEKEKEHWKVFIESDKIYSLSDLTASCRAVKKSIVNYITKMFKKLDFFFMFLMITVCKN